MTDRPTIQTSISRALEAYESLAGLGETIDDEWMYVSELSAAWQDRLEAIAAARGAEAIDDRTAAAIDGAIDEIGRIEDPHRAIDWLSTFPQVILVALGEPT